MLLKTLYYVIQTSNPAWPPSLFFNSPISERLKDLSVKNWSQLAGSGPVPWRQAPTLFSSIPPTEMHSRGPYDVDISTAINKLNTGERIAVSSLEKRKIEDFSERLLNGNFKLGPREILENGTTGIYSFIPFMYYQGKKKKRQEKKVKEEHKEKRNC